MHSAKEKITLRQEDFFKKASKESAAFEASYVVSKMIDKAG